MVLTDIRSCPTFVINLDRRKDRWETFSEQPALTEFNALQRFSAVDGSKIDVAYDERISLHTRQNILKKTRRSHYEISTAGAIGATLSHVSIWKQFLQGDSDYIVVFEDDTIVDQKALNYIDKLIPRLPSEWHMWLLGNHGGSFNGKPLIPGDKKSWWQVTGFTGAHAYILSRKGAEILLEDPFPIETHIEYYITACSQLKGLILIKHWALRMSYFMEKTEILDSDTFEGRKTCPVCYIPDNFPEVGFYMSYDHFYRAAVGVLALGIVGWGAYLGMHKRKN
jgi:hypothetical protein